MPIVKKEIMPDDSYWTRMNGTNVMYSVYKYDGSDPSYYIGNTSDYDEAYGKLYDRAAKSEERDKKVEQRAEEEAKQEEEAKRAAAEEEAKAKEKTVNSDTFLDELEEKSNEEIWSNEEDAAEEAPVKGSNSQEDVAKPAEDTTEGADPASDTPANDATASSKPEDNQLSPTDANAQGSQASPSTEEPGRGATIDPNNTMTKGTAYPVIKINDTYISQHEIVEFYVETGYFRNPMEYQTEKLLKTGFVPTMHLVV
jgi:hypothetical protein